ncbi:MAG: PilX N-terminal domain-containing pilus assembly protein [Magnetococcus sp. DMHC-6]
MKNIVISYSKERGSVLIISIVLLLILTLLALGSMKDSVMEERMAGSFRDQNLAFQAAESALRNGEAFIETLATTSDFNILCTQGLCSKEATPDPFQPNQWGSGFSKSYSGTIAGVSDPPRYYIQVIGAIQESSGTEINLNGYGESVGQGDVTGFRVKALGRGSANTSQVLLESYYGKRL